MKRLMVPFLILLLMVPLIPAQGRVPTTISTVTIDGDIAFSAPNYTRDAAGNDIDVRESQARRGFIEWDISSISDSALIKKVSIRFRTYTLASYGGDLDFYKMTNRPNSQPDNNAGNQVIYDDAHDGTLYCTTPTVGGTIPDTWLTFELVGAETDLQSQLAANWFAVGIHSDLAATNKIYASETAYDPEIIIEWGLPTDYAFYFDDAVYENNTSAGPVNVSAVLPTVAEDFTVDGPTWFYSPDLPTYFTWEVSAGVYRRIHVSASENFTITLPESTFTSFGFTLKDFTGETNTGTLYFETRRVIGGVERIIERIPVLQTINLITTTMVTNRNYVVQLTVGSTIYRYTFFSSPADTTPTIVLNDISFERQIQLSSKYVYVDADRPTPTSLRVNYTNTRTDTNSVQVRIRHMNGTLVNSTNIVSDSFTYTYNPVDNETAYYFDLIINTDTFGRLTWKKTLPWQPNFSNIPDPFTQLGTIGGLNVSRLFGFTLILFTALLFSAKDVSIACFSIAITTSLMSYWGFFPVPVPILAVVVGLSVLIGLGLRGR